MALQHPSSALLQAPVHQLPQGLAQRDPRFPGILHQALGHLFGHLRVRQNRAVALPTRSMPGTNSGPERLADVGMGGHQGSQGTAGREPPLASQGPERGGLGRSDANRGQPARARLLGLDGVGVSH